MVGVPHVVVFVLILDVGVAKKQLESWTEELSCFNEIGDCKSRAFWQSRSLPH